MDQLELLDIAGTWFTATMAQVTDSDWASPTPCDDWNVGDLVDHVIGGNRFTTQILAGATADDALSAVMASFANDDDRFEQVRSSTEAQSLAFHAEGALETICHHVVGDITGARVLGFRLTDLTLHGWDLARAIGSDTNIDHHLVEAVWKDMEPLAAVIAGTGRFGDGPSGAVAHDAPLQERLLDLSGRRI